MKDIIIRYYTGQPIQVDEIVKILEEYMRRTNNTNPELIKAILSPNNPFRNGLINKAVQVSVDYLCGVYDVVKLLDRDGNLLMVY